MGIINPNIRHAFIIINGEDVNPGKITSAQTIDVAHSYLTFFGINIKPEWNLQGKTIGLKNRCIYAFKFTLTHKLVLMFLT
ncbi:MAG: hypothetical protein R2760_00710 [Chitinophagales bacterium]